MRLSQEDLRRLTPEEKRELVRRQLLEGDIHVEGTAPGRKGYVTISSADGTVRQVPYTEALTAYYKPGSIRVETDTIGAVPIRQQTFQIDVPFDKKPHVRRAPSARLDSMAKRLIDEWKRGALTEATLKEIAGEYWKNGTPVSADELRRVAARLLSEAEAKRKRQFDKKVAAPWSVR